MFNRKSLVWFTDYSIIRIYANDICLPAQLKTEIPTSYWWFYGLPWDSKNYQNSISCPVNDIGDTTWDKQNK